MNRLLICGRVVKDAELKYIQNTNGLAKLTFTVAVDREYQKDKENKKTDFIPCVILGKRAESLSAYVIKGKQVAVQGELHIENVKLALNGGDEEWKTYVSLQVDIFEFLSSSNNSKNEKNEKDKTFTAIDLFDDDLPF